MKTQTLFIVASAIIGALAAPVQRREAQPDVITVYENVVHIVTTTSTVYVPPSNPTPASAPEKKVEEVQEEPEVVEEPEEVEVKKPAPTPTPTPTPTPSPKPATTSVYVPPTTKAEPTQAPAPTKAPEPAPEPEKEEEEVEASSGDQQEATSGSAGMITGGEATYYDPAMGSCGEVNSGSELIAALPRAVMEAQEGGNSNNNPLCGRYVQVVRNKDKDGKPMTPKTVKVKVVDKCMGCDPEDIDLSLAAFEQLGVEADGRFAVDWKLL